MTIREMVTTELIYIYIYIYIYIFLLLIGYYKILSIVPYAIY